MQNLPQVHAQVEAIFAQETELSARQRSLRIIRGALGDEVADMVLAKAVPEYSPIEDALNDLGKSLHAKKFPQDIVEQVYTGQLREDALSLDAALSEYAEFKSDSPKAHKEITQRVTRLRKDMVAVFGKQKLQYVPLTDITRADANALRDHLLARVSPNSAVRMLSVLKAAVNFAITEHSLHMHSLCHRMKDKLRNTGCPEAISMAILGHSANTVAANYGSGYALEVMQEHMEKVWGS